jgi:hypothetical protein
MIVHNLHFNALIALYPNKSRQEFHWHDFFTNCFSWFFEPYVDNSQQEPALSLKNVKRTKKPVPRLFFHRLIKNLTYTYYTPYEKKTNEIQRCR